MAKKALINILKTRLIVTKLHLRTRLRPGETVINNADSTISKELKLPEKLINSIIGEYWENINIGLKLRRNEK